MDQKVIDGQMVKIILNKQDENTAPTPAQRKKREKKGADRNKWDKMCTTVACYFWCKEIYRFKIH